MILSCVMKKLEEYKIDKNVIINKFNFNNKKYK